MKEQKKTNKKIKKKKSNPQNNDLIISKAKFENFEEDVSKEFEKLIPEKNLPEKRMSKPLENKSKNPNSLTPQLHNFFAQLLQKKHMMHEARKFSQDELLSLLKNDKLFNSHHHPEKFNFILTILRKQNPLKFYERPEIMRSIEYINENLSSLLPENIAEFSVNLSNMKIETLEFYKNIEEFVLNNSYKFNLRSLANIVHSFIFISQKQSVISDFQHMYKELETIIALKIKKTDISELDTKSINQIMIAYSKTQNFSNEFLYFMEQITLEIFDNLNPQELSNIIYSFWKNKHQCITLIDKLGICIKFCYFFFI